MRGVHHEAIRDIISSWKAGFTVSTRVILSAEDEVGVVGGAPFGRVAVEVSDGPVDGADPVYVLANLNCL